MFLAHTAIAPFRDISASHDMSVVKRDGNSGTGLALCMSLSLAPSWMGRCALSALLTVRDCLSSWLARASCFNALAIAKFAA